MTKGRDILWDLDGTEFELADMEGEPRSKPSVTAPAASPVSGPEASLASPSLPANYNLKTEIIKNQTELLAMLLKGMRQ